MSRRRAAGESAEDRPLEVMTFNLRFAHPEPPDLWADRRPVVCELIHRWAPDLIGTQEGLYGQVTDLALDLPGYRWIGLGRDGGSHGEFMAVFYLRHRLVPEEFDHFWLSDTPEVIGSRSWGNRTRRMVTWVRFRDLQSGCTFYFVNTHFDHQVQHARECSARLVLERTRAFPAGRPVLLAGDFNSPAGSSPVYDLLTGPDAFSDSWRAAGVSEPPIGSYHAFEGPAGAAERGRIDWVLTRGPVTVLAVERITLHRDGQYPSDHFPVSARVRLGNCHDAEHRISAGA
jgi:endonuclease/exonuclease/phosphatase family metal-dependent hydrolase